ncbi:hypothetical protein KLI87_18880 [Actinomadura sp. NEAU-AAG7]|nr:hypothetical protein [Actinomadura sp. NEAU-AAG7]
MLEEAGVQQKLIDQRMGHEDGSMRSRYTHVTRKIRDRLLACCLTCRGLRISLRRTRER